MNLQHSYVRLNTDLSTQFPTESTPDYIVRKDRYFAAKIWTAKVGKKIEQRIV